MCLIQVCRFIDSCRIPMLYIQSNTGFISNMTKMSKQKTNYFLQIMTKKTIFNAFQKKLLLTIHSTRWVLIVCSSALEFTVLYKGISVWFPCWCGLRDVRDLGAARLFCAHVILILPGGSVVSAVIGPSSGARVHVCATSISVDHSTVKQQHRHD